MSYNVNIWTFYEPVSFDSKILFTTERGEEREKERERNIDVREKHQLYTP